MEDNTKMEVKINNMEYTIVSNESEGVCPARCAVGE